VSSPAADVAGLLEELLRGAGLRVSSDVADSLSPPVVVVGPARMTWAGYGRAPQLVYPLFVVVPADGRIVERLYELVPQVVAAVEGGDVDARVTEARPTTSDGLPAYEVLVEVSP